MSPNLPSNPSSLIATSKVQISKSADLCYPRMGWTQAAIRLIGVQIVPIDFSTSITTESLSQGSDCFMKPNTSFTLEVLIA